MATESTYDNMLIEDLKTGRRGSKKKKKKPDNTDFSPWTKIGVKEEKKYGTR